MNKIVISPSLLAADFAQMGREVANLDIASADWVHVDVMDGQFVPQISFGAGMVKAIRKYTDHPLDVHLMVQESSRFIEEFAKAGADIITVHVESEQDVSATIDLIHSFNLRAGVAISPDTPVSALKGVVDKVDMVLVMTVEPGYGGQPFLHRCVEKIAQVRELCPRENLRVQVDGGINLDTVHMVIQAGADTLVAGSAVFGAKNKATAISALRRG